MRSDDPVEAEVAVTVVDDWQGRGAATALLESLVERAREEGVERFVALVMSENTDALELAAHLAPDAESRGEARRATSSWSSTCPSRERSRGRCWARALHAAARGALLANPWRVIRDRIAR